MTKIANRAGHTETSCGASGILNENYEARQVKKYVNEYLSKYSEVIDVQPPEDMAYPDELNYGINKINSLSNVDLSFSIHFNNAYNTYDGALGTETLIYPNSKAYGSAKAIVDKLSSLGFKNRGVIERSNLGELRCVNNGHIIIEVCFVEATEDARIYKALGAKAIAKAIVEGIIGQDIIEEVEKPSQPLSQMPTKPMYITTKYLPFSYNGYDGVEVDKIIHSYFEDIKCYIRSDSSNRIWIETEYVKDLDKLNRVVNNLNNANLYYSVTE